ncbi:hypothetical protein A3F29_04510 [Candidatus Roizmanbacteria bacterium RIFCSPHIGHO2_12_FULL_33_9]|uniref:Glycosyltransferase subfamily 4-like N-terminal domain-containing protein n=1 Tax=Candidatus Roizmanbacteria bacterium RIFCSPHIGHO2_12_FULL_33_9 TaxID=1802045 RepID=A0A1F7HJZ7_9BACT|nr:MAG: hypothetical protein A3F29_04510 [Candidatus Roizmanbacteria bacterium RIFCSPHIGHO2_12_FULL_33_9]
MRIGIDISQLAYEETGVSNYLFKLLVNLFKIDKKNDYILFFSSLRRDLPLFIESKLREGNRATIKKFKFPPTFLEIIWNKYHSFPIERFVGDVDIFITSDWTEPPSRNAKKATIIYDLVVYKNPQETSSKIVETHKRKLKWVKMESDLIFCISEASKKDAMEILGIEEKRLKVIYPGI